jgi:adenosylcobinamide-GDP ribazoletransferase
VAASVIVRAMTDPDRASRRAGFGAAVGFFTRIPVGAPFAADWHLADAGWAFPLVGAGIGAVAGFVFVAAQLIGLGDWLPALLAMLAGLLLTGAIHEDGLADAADGLLGGPDRESKLAIMRDSRHGTYGILAIVMSIGLRAAALAQIGEAVHAGLALVAAHAASRAMLPSVMRALPPARGDGLGAAAGRPRVAAAIAAAVIAVGIGLAALGPLRGAVALGCSAVAVFAAAAFARRQIDGYTGDVLGAFQQIGEIVILLAAVAR